MTASTYVGNELHLFAQAVTWKRYIRRLLEPYVAGAVLEVGAGVGGTTRALRAMTSGAWTCLEPDPALRPQLERSAPGISARTGSIADLGAGERFDTILYIDVLEHIADDAGELVRAAGVLAPGGRLIVLSPAYPWLYTPFDAAVGHHRRYTRDTLSALRPPGTTLVRAFYADSAGMLASTANRFLLRSSMPTLRQIQIWDRLIVPVSLGLDRVLGFRVGKSVIAVWQAPGA